MTNIEKRNVEWKEWEDECQYTLLTKEISRTNVEGNTGRGRLRRTVSDHIEVVLKENELRFEKNQRGLYEKKRI